MKLAEYCNISPGYIGEIESGRKFPSPDMIEKIAYVLRIEPYLFLKKQRGSNFISDDEDNGERQLPRLPYNIKKQIKAKIKRQIKKQVNNQINAQVNLSMNEILNEIDDILDNS